MCFFKRYCRGESRKLYGIYGCHDCGKEYITDETGYNIIPCPECDPQMYFEFVVTATECAG